MTVYAVPGYEPDHLSQEARLALLEAGEPTGALATVVVRRRLIDLLRTATRGKQRVLNESIRELRDVDGMFVPAVDLLPGGRDPADVIVERERVRAIVAALDELTPLERDALRAVASGTGYRFDKRTDNAVQRARRKLRAAG